jgi:hypothetical protein
MFDDLKKWIERDTRRWWVQTQQTEAKLTCTITTDRYVFTVSASDDWLGATCRTRKRLPGEAYFRFADLPDGKLTEETWRELGAEIRRMDIPPYRGPAL